MSIFKKLFSPITAVLNWLVDIPEPTGEQGQLLTKPATDAPIKIPYGRKIKTTGVVAWQRTNDNDNDKVKNDLLHQFIVWGDGQVNEFFDTQIDDVSISNSKFDGKDGKRWAHVLYFPNGVNGSFRDQTLLNAGFKPDDYLFEDLAVSYVRLEQNTKGIFSGNNNITSILSGRKCIYNKASQLQHDHATEYPAPQLYDYLIDDISGKGLQDSDIDYSSFVTAEDQCKELVYEYQGSTGQIPRFTSNFMLDTSRKIIDNVNIFLKAMRGSLPVIDGKLTLVLDVDKPPVDPMIAGEHFYEKDFNLEHGDINSKFNQVSVSYRDPFQNWQEVEVIWPEVGSAEDIAFQKADGGVVDENDNILQRVDRTKKLKLETCTNHYEARSFARALCQRSRESLRASVIGFPITWKYTPGDIIPITTSKFAAKLFRVEETELLLDGNTSLELVEHQPYIDTWLSDKPKPEVPDTNLPRVDEVTQPTNVQLVESANQSVVLSFESDYSTFDVWVTDANNEKVIELPNRSVKSINLGYLSNGEYRAFVIAKNKLGYESQASFSAQLTPSKPATPTSITTDKSDLVWQHANINSVKTFNIILNNGSERFGYDVPAVYEQAEQRLSLTSLASGTYTVRITAVGKNTLESEAATVANLVVDGLSVEIAKHLEDKIGGSGINIADEIFGLPWPYDSAKLYAPLQTITVNESVLTPLGESNTWQLQCSSAATQVITHAKGYDQFNIPLTNDDGDKVLKPLIVSMFVRHDSLASVTGRFGLGTQNGTHYQSFTTSAISNEFKRVSVVLDLNNDAADICYVKLEFSAPSGNFEWSHLMVEWQLGNSAEPSPYYPPRDSIKSAAATKEEIIAAITPESLGVYTKAESDGRFGLLSQSNDWAGNQKFLSGNTYFAGSTAHLRSDNPFSFLTNSGSAQQVRASSLLTSSSYSDASKVPSYGIYAKGIITTAEKLRVENHTPVLELKDVTNTSGGAQTGWISLKDMNNSERAWMGFGWSSNTDLGIVNSDGVVKLQGQGGELTVASSYIDLGEKVLLQGDGSKYLTRNNQMLRWTNANGYIDIGANNTSWAHFYTDRPGFYMNKKLHVDADIQVYGSSTRLTASDIYEAGSKLSDKYLELAELSYGSANAYAVANSIYETFAQDQAAGLFDNYDGAYASLATGFVDGIMGHFNLLATNKANINRLSARSIEVTGRRDLINNFSSTNNVDGYSNAGPLVEEVSLNGAVVRTMKMTTSGNWQVNSNMVENIDHDAIYEVNLSIYSAHGDNTGTRYFGMNSYTDDDVNTVVDYINPSTKTLAGTTTNNPYFWYGDVSGGNWRHMKAYIVGANVDLTNMPDASNVFYCMRLKPNVTKFRLRWLNYYNSGTTVTNHFYNVSCREIGAGKLSVDNMFVGNADITNLKGKFALFSKLTADEIDVTNLFAQNVTASGKISGATLIGAEGNFTNGLSADYRNAYLQIGKYHHQGIGVNTDVAKIGVDGSCSVTCNASGVLSLEANSKVLIGSGVDVLKSILMHKNLTRAEHHVGHLEGSYNNVNPNGNYTNPIYTIGSSYNPISNSLSNMYGIGFAHSGAAFLNSTDLGETPSGWGLYVAEQGKSGLFFSGKNGHVYAKGNVYCERVYARTDITLTSDESVKTNKRPIVNASAIINQITGHIVDRTDVDLKDQYTLIAQDVYKAEPRLTARIDGDKLGLQQYGFTALLVEGHKQHSEQLADQLNKIKSLQKQINKMKKVA